MYCLTNLCYVCLETKNNLISSVDSSVSVNKDLLDMFGYCAHNLAWLKTKRIILICEECCSRLRETYQFLKMWHKNSEQLQVYMDTENEAELLVHLKDIHQVKCEIKDEQIYTDEYQPIIEETQDVFANIEDSLTIEEDTWKKDETDDREEYSMDNTSIESMNNESATEISVNSNTHITNTILNTENEADPSVHLKDIHQVKCEIKDEELYTDEYEPIIEETQDVFVNIEDPLTIKEGTLKKDETDDREEYSMDNNSTESMNNESDSEISVHSNTNITDTVSVRSEFTCKQMSATNKTDSNTPANKPHTCATCSISFTKKGELKMHTRIHTGEKPYKCDTCDKCFTQHSSLVRHMRTHTSEKPYQCTRCEKCFTQQSSLVCHMRTHTSEKPYQCARCDKCFMRQQGLIDHMRTHTGEKPYKCARCDKCFAQKPSLVRHMRTHTGEKPYKCTGCNKCFGHKTSLERHIRRHTGEKF